MLHEEQVNRFQTHHSPTAWRVVRNIATLPELLTVGTSKQKANQKVSL